MTTIPESQCFNWDEPPPEPPKVTPARWPDDGQVIVEGDLTIEGQPGDVVQIGLATPDDPGPIGNALQSRAQARGRSLSEEFRAWWSGL